jgi:hypothetical protein
MTTTENSNTAGAVSLKVLAERKIEGIQKTTQFQVDPRLVEVEVENPDGESTTLDAMDRSLAEQINDTVGNIAQGMGGKQC